MSAEPLFDTNILVYLHDNDEPRKQARAYELLRSATERGSVRFCAQVLGEYSSVLLRKFDRVFSPIVVRQQLVELVHNNVIYDTTVDVVLEAARGVQLHGFSYYDAQIWAVAKLNGIPLVYSEDFTHGREVEGVRFENPFVDLDEHDPCGCDPES